MFSHHYLRTLYNWATSKKYKACSTTVAKNFTYAEHRPTAYPDDDDDIPDDDDDDEHTLKKYNKKIIKTIFLKNDFLPLTSQFLLKSMIYAERKHKNRLKGGFSPALGLEFFVDGWFRNTINKHFYAEKLCLM